MSSCGRCNKKYFSTLKALLSWIIKHKFERKSCIRICLHTSFSSSSFSPVAPRIIIRKSGPGTIFAEGTTVTLVKNFVDLGYTQNRGMVFGILNGKMPVNSRTFLVVVRIAILIWLTVFVVRNFGRTFWYLFPFVLVCAGAIGNLVDPFAYGYVVDFIHIRAGNLIEWPFFFNLADAYVTIGIAIIAVASFLPARWRSFLGLAK